MANKFEMTQHTEAKHDILERYLEQWFPILNSWQAGLAYIDGFAGPGVYSKDERGSPIIALEAANKYSGSKGFHAHLWFVEPDRESFESLGAVVSRVEQKDGIRVEGILRSTFEESFPGIVEQLQEEHGMPPTFAFVDPDGFSTVKMRTLVNFLENPRCEFMFTFMDGFVKRFSSLPEDARKKSLDDLFGTKEWAEAESLPDAKKAGFFLDLYVEQLRTHNVGYTQTFEMCNKNKQTIYHLVFATNNKRGLEAMKEAMVRVDPKFTFRVTDADDPGQSHFLSFGNDKGWYEQAASLIFRRFAGESDVLLDDVKWFVIIDTPYVYRPGIVRQMEKAGLIVDRKAHEPATKKVGLRDRVTFARERPAKPGRIDGA